LKNAAVLLSKLILCYFYNKLCVFFLDTRVTVPPSNFALERDSERIRKR